MIYIYSILGVLAIVGLLYAVWPYLGGKTKVTEHEYLGELLDKGITYEEEFITEYLRVMRDEGFMEYFGAHRMEAAAIMKVLIDQSEEHKKTLLDVRKKILG